MKKYIWNDFKSKPAYYIGGVAVGGAIGKKVIPGIPMKEYDKMFPKIPLIPATLKDVGTMTSLNFYLKFQAQFYVKLCLKKYYFDEFLVIDLTLFSKEQLLFSPFLQAFEK